MTLERFARLQALIAGAASVTTERVVERAQADQG